MQYKQSFIAAVVALATFVGAANANATTVDSKVDKEALCLKLVAKADEKATKKADYMESLNDAIAKINGIEVPENAGVDPAELEARKQAALEKANELKTRLESVYTEYNSIRPNIDCSDPEAALELVREARNNVQGGSFMSKYTGDLDIAKVNSDARETAKTVFGAFLAK